MVLESIPWDYERHRELSLSLFLGQGRFKVIPLVASLHRYVQGEEVLRYLDHVADKHQLKKDIHFNTALVSAKWMPDPSKWSLETNQGTFIARYFIGAVGLLSVPVYPDIPGIDNFQGRSVHSCQWPQDLDCTNKRVGVIGSGSTGVQIITSLALKVQSLTCFQRNPQYTVPSGNRPVTTEEREQINDDYDRIYGDVKNSALGFGFTESNVMFSSKTPEEREAIFENLWRHGNGLRFMFAGFADITYNREANEATCAFIRKKIAEIVKDPIKARKLQPTQLYARRPLCDNGYYEQFNRDNVDIVHLQETPISRVTPEGIHTEDGNFYELDVIIYATGFDAAEGAYNQIEITGAQGETLRQRWDRLGPTSYLGISVSGFLNFLMVFGPQGPFANVPPALEIHVDLITALIRDAESSRKSNSSDAVVEAEESAEIAWVDKCSRLTAGSLFAETPSWLFGHNVAGKRTGPRFYFGGIKAFLAEVQSFIENGYVGMKPIKEKGTGKQLLEPNYSKL